MNIRNITRLPLRQGLKVLKSDGVSGVTFAGVRFQSDQDLDKSAPRPEHFHRTSKFDKYCFVWTKKYKSIDEVPNMVSWSAIMKCRDLMRIRVSLMMVVGGAFLCYLGVLWGKYDKSRGITMEKVAKEKIDRIVEKYHGKQNEEEK